MGLCVDEALMRLGLTDGEGKKTKNFLDLLIYLLKGTVEDGLHCDGCITRFWRHFIVWNF